MTEQCAVGPALRLTGGPLDSADMLAALQEELHGPVMEALTSDLVRMRSRPFGVDEQGRPINHGSGKLVTSAIAYMQDCVAEQTRADAPPGASAAEVEALVEGARSAATDRLVAMLNAAIEDERYHVTREYLLNPSNNYSYEFRLFVADYCRVLSGNPDFFYSQGDRAIPPIIGHLGRPLGVQQLYQVLSHFTAKFVKTDLRSVQTTPTSAVVQWRGASQAELVPEQHREAYIRYACRTYQGVFSSIPSVVFGLARATARELQCQAQGDECCEWEFVWVPRERDLRLRLPLAGGALGSAVLLAGLLLQLPWVELLAVAGGAALPAAAGWAIGRTRQLRAEENRLRALLLDQREQSEAQYDASERANAELQVANVELTQRLSELTTLQEVGRAISATLDLDELLERSLRAVVSHLKFERAMVLLLDEERGVLTNGRSVGGTPEATALVASVALPIDLRVSQLVQVFHADEPLIFHDADQDADPANRAMAQQLGTRSFLGVPLIAKGRRLGVLAVDNGHSDRPIARTDAALLFTVGNHIASAVENARLYRQIETHNRTLEERVEHRTEQLARATAEAEEARAVAEGASATKSAFLANMSHELRTPLNAIIGYSEMLLEEAEQDGQESLGADLRKIQGSGKHLLGLINDVLDLSKIEAGKIELFAEAFDVAELLSQVEATVQPLAEVNGNTLRIASPPDAGAMYSDVTRLRQVLLNLLSNACKFTEQGSVALEVARETDGSGADWLEFRVADNGIGMNADQLRRLFQPFTQADASTTRKYGGTGLGLVISRRFCQMMGGDIQVDSQAGGGSTFVARVPARLPDDGRAETDDAREHGARTPTMV